MTDWRQFQTDVRLRLEHDGKAHLRPVFDDVLGVGRRLRDVDDTLFLVRNTLRGRFEVHCLEHRPSTFAWQVPWETLDGRVLEKALYNRVGRVSTSQYLRSIDDHNDRLERTKEREFGNYTDSFVREFRPLFKKAVEAQE